MLNPDSYRGTLMQLTQKGRFGAMEIAKAEPKDADSIEQLRFRVWFATYPNGAYGVTTEDIRRHFSSVGSSERTARLAARLADSEFRKQMFLAKDGGALVGVCRIIPHQKSGGLNRIHSMYVLPDYQRRGIGTALWNAGKEVLDLASATLLYVAEYTVRAICFYERLGFVETGEQEPGKFCFPSGARIPRIEMVRRPGW